MENLWKNLIKMECEGGTTNIKLEEYIQNLRKRWSKYIKFSSFHYKLFHLTKGGVRGDFRKVGEAYICTSQLFYMFFLGPLQIYR